MVKDEALRKMVEYGIVETHVLDGEVEYFFPLEERVIKDAIVADIARSGFATTLTVKQDLREHGYWVKQQDMRDWFAQLRDEGWLDQFRGPVYSVWLRLTVPHGPGTQCMLSAPV